MSPQGFRDGLDASIERICRGQQQEQAAADATEAAPRERLALARADEPDADARLLGQLDELPQDLDRLHGSAA